MGTKEHWEPNGDGSETLFMNGKSTNIRRKPSGWRREDDPFLRRYTTGGAHTVESFLEDKKQLLEELGLILDRELSYVRDFHLVRIKVVLELCH
jgi:hypothetical protein